MTLRPDEVSSAAPKGPGALAQQAEDPRADRPTSSIEDRIESDFRYHGPRPDQLEAFDAIRNQARELARTIVRVVPKGREQSSALTRLEEAVMHANAGIARHG